MGIAPDLDMTFGHILVAIDFSEPSRIAAEVAASLARRCGGRLELVHVYDPAPLSPFITYPTSIWTDASLAEQLRKEAETAMSELRTDFSAAEAHVIPGSDVAETLAQHARARGSELIVLASHGRTGLERFLLGSVAERVVREAPCPVLVSRATAASDAFPERVQVCTDLSAAAAAGLRLAGVIAKTFGSTAEIVHAEDPRHEELDVNVHRDIVTELTAELKTLHAAHFSSEARVSVLAGKSAADAITSHAQRTEPDCLVLATHGRTGIARLLMGSVAERVIRHAPCSVWVARSHAPPED